MAPKIRKDRYTKESETPLAKSSTKTAEPVTGPGLANLPADIQKLIAQKLENHGNQARLAVVSKAMRNAVPKRDYVPYSRIMFSIMRGILKKGKRIPAIGNCTMLLSHGMFKIALGRTTRGFFMQAMIDPYSTVDAALRSAPGYVFVHDTYSTISLHTEWAETLEKLSDLTKKSSWTKGVEEYGGLQLVPNLAALEAGVSASWPEVNLDSMTTFQKAMSKSYNGAKPKLSMEVQYASRTQSSLPDVKDYISPEKMAMIKHYFVPRLFYAMSVTNDLYTSSKGFVPRETFLESQTGHKTINVRVNQGARVPRRSKQGQYEIISSTEKPRSVQRNGVSFKRTSTGVYVKCNGTCDVVSAKNQDTFLHLEADPENPSWHHICLDLPIPGTNTNINIKKKKEAIHIINIV